VTYTFFDLLKFPSKHISAIFGSQDTNCTFEKSSIFLLWQMPREMRRIVLCNRGGTVRVKLVITNLSICLRYQIAIYSTSPSYSRGQKKSENMEILRTIFRLVHLQSYMIQRFRDEFYSLLSVFLSRRFTVLPI
jgi:hypothetical protein